MERAHQRGQHGAQLVEPLPSKHTRQTGTHSKFSVSVTAVVLVITSVKGNTCIDSGNKLI
jgi:hypothetical protein